MTDFRTVAPYDNVSLVSFQTFLLFSSLQRQTPLPVSCAPLFLLRPLHFPLRFIHPHYPPSIPLCLYPITLCSPLILPHLLSLDSGVRFSPDHEFYMTVHLCIWKSPFPLPLRHSLLFKHRRRRKECCSHLLPAPFPH